MGPEQGKGFVGVGNGRMKGSEVECGVMVVMTLAVAQHVPFAKHCYWFMYIYLLLKQPYEVRIVTIPILQMWTLRHRGVK